MFAISRGRLLKCVDIVRCGNIEVGSKVGGKLVDDNFRAGDEMFNHYNGSYSA